MAPRREPESLETFRLPQVPPESGTPVDIKLKRGQPVRGSFWTVVRTDPWQVSGAFRIDAGRLVITALTLRPNEYHSTEEGIDEQDDWSLAGPNGVTSALLRAIQLGPLMAGIRTALQQHPMWVKQVSHAVERSGGHAPFDTGYVETAAAAAVELGEPPKRGRKGYGDDWYRGVARLYLALQDEGWSRGILSELARHYDRPRDTVATWVREARKRELLTAGSPGRAGAQPGPRLATTEEGEQR